MQCFKAPGCRMLCVTAVTAGCRLRHRQLQLRRHALCIVNTGLGARCAQPYHTANSCRCCERPHECTLPNLMIM